jgi:DNA-binding MarR family transcriptional regulator
MNARDTPTGAHVYSPLFGQEDVAGVQHLPLRLRVLTHLYGRVAERTLESTGLSLARYVVLSGIDVLPGASGAALAELTAQTPQSLNGIVFALEADGLIERRQGHGRQKLHHLTAHGRQALVAARQAVAAPQRRVFGALGAERLDRLIDDLNECMDRLVLELGPSDA